MRTLIDIMRIEAQAIDPQNAFFYGTSMSDLHKWDSKKNDYVFCEVIDKAPYIQFHIASMTTAKGSGKVNALCVLAYRTLTANNGVGSVKTQDKAISDLYELVTTKLQAHKWILQGDISITPLFREPNFQLTTGAILSFGLVGSNSDILNCC
jgi:hypothetical protein